MRRFTFQPRVEPKRRDMRSLIVIAPHQDDEWIGCAYLMNTYSRQYYGSLTTIIVAESLWPANVSYNVRKAESRRGCMFLGSGYLALGLKEEDLFNPPYDPVNYIGDALEPAWAPVLKSKIQAVTKNKVWAIAFPSAKDALGHVVHNFTRNITQSALSTLNPVEEIQYTNYSLPLDPPVEKPREVPPAFESVKRNGLMKFYPTQWAEFLKDGTTMQIINHHMGVEYGW